VFDPSGTEATPAFDPEAMPGFAPSGTEVTPAFDPEAIPGFDPSGTEATWTWGISSPMWHAAP
jgi:hypothetical protein